MRHGSGGPHGLRQGIQEPACPAPGDSGAFLACGEGGKIEHGGGQDFKANGAKFSKKSLLGFFCKNLAKILLEFGSTKNTIRSKKLGLIAQETQRYRAKNSQL